jgi:hypothetical protein
MRTGPDQTLLFCRPPVIPRLKNLDSVLDFKLHRSEFRPVTVLLRQAFFETCRAH